MEKKCKLLQKALEQVPVGVLVISSKGYLINMNQIGFNWFQIVLNIGDDVKRKLTDLDDHPLDLLTKTEGSFSVGQSVFRFICTQIINESEKVEVEEEEGDTYLSVCVYDDTERYQRLLNAEEIAQLLKIKSLSLRPETKKDDEDMETFVRECSLDAGLGFEEDPNASMIRYSPTGVVVQCNKPVRGFPRDEIIGLLAYDHIHPDDIEKTVAYHLTLLNDPRPIVPVYCWLRKKHKNGSYVHTEIIGAYHAHKEESERWICGVERVMCSERMERMLSSVTDQIPCGVIMVGKKSDLIEMCNPNAFDWLKIERGKCFLTHVESLRNISFSSEECDKLLRSIQQCNIQPENKRDTEITVKTLQGRVLTFLCRSNITLQPTEGSPVDTRTDRVLIWIVNDVTALSTAMEEKHSAIIRFMKCTSHDMRTPMQAISLAAHSLSDDSNDPKNDIDTIISSSAVLETIMSNILEFKTISSMKLIPNPKPMNICENLKCIVNMLKHSTLINEGVVLSYHCNWLTSSKECNDFKKQSVLLDSHMFDRIILNLVSNALKFTTKGYVKVICSLISKTSSSYAAADDAIARGDNKIMENNNHDVQSNTHDDDKRRKIASFDDDGDMTTEDNPITLRIEIIDTGCGMDETSQEHVGELDFFSGNAGGFGLGTFIVRTYVQALYGSFRVQSKVNEGTTMVVEIPTKLIKCNQNRIDGINKEHLEERLKHSSSLSEITLNKTTKKDNQTQPPTSSLTSSINIPSLPPPSSSLSSSSSINQGLVLVVEDINVNRKLLVKSLERGNFQVEQAENGAIALQKMLTTQYNTVFMDIDMPVMTGDVAVREYWKQCDPTLKQHPKIIMLTGNITDADREMALACGAHEFLTKPVVPKQLWAAASWNNDPPRDPASKH